jgi:hypothetical protein
MGFEEFSISQLSPGVIDLIDYLWNNIVHQKTRLFLILPVKNTVFLFAQVLNLTCLYPGQIIKQSPPSGGSKHSPTDGCG